MRYLLALLVLLPSASDAVPPVPPPKQWDRFTMLVWQFKTDVLQDKALYESLNLRGFHVDRQNGKLQAFAKESGWPYYVDHAADKGFLHLWIPSRARRTSSSGRTASPTRR